MSSVRSSGRRLLTVGSIVALGVVYVLALTLGTLLTTARQKAASVRAVGRSLATALSQSQSPQP